MADIAITAAPMEHGWMRPPGWGESEKAWSLKMSPPCFGTVSLPAASSAATRLPRSERKLRPERHLEGVLAQVPMSNPCRPWMPFA